MKRKRPTISIEGTEFLIDADKLELREKGNPKNIISFEDMNESIGGYCFSYSLKNKNVPSLFETGDVLVEIPEWVRMDPEGIAKKYGVRSEEIMDKTDFDLMVDQDAYDLRVSKGYLPTVEIAGHLFYVDLRMDKLRPHDDFSSEGIVFSEIESYYEETSDSYVIPYNPQTREFQEPDYETITEFPTDLIAVCLPLEQKLDPVGWNRLHGYDAKDGLKHTGLRPHFNAPTIRWEETGILEVIQDNRKKMGKTQEDKKGLHFRQDKRGRGL